MLCARQSLYQPLRQAVDHTVNRQLLVGNREPSRMDKLSICQCTPSGRVTPWLVEVAAAFQGALFNNDPL
jgi:hypothetical protein